VNPMMIHHIEMSKGHHHRVQCNPHNNSQMIHHREQCTRRLHIECNHSNSLLFSRSCKCHLHTLGNHSPHLHTLSDSITTQWYNMVMVSDFTGMAYSTAQSEQQVNIISSTPHTPSPHWVINKVCGRRPQTSSLHSEQSQ